MRLLLLGNCSCPLLARFLQYEIVAEMEGDATPGLS
jgi:hypothetical protein